MYWFDLIFFLLVVEPALPLRSRVLAITGVDRVVDRVVIYGL